VIIDCLKWQLNKILKIGDKRVMEEQQTNHCEIHLTTALCKGTYDNANYTHTVLII